MASNPSLGFCSVQVVNIELIFRITQALAQNTKDVHDLIRC